MSSRIEKIKETYAEQFQKKLKEEKVEISLDTAWDILISADPAKNKKNVRWLVETYINDGYLWEDTMGGPTSKVSETITEFDKHKRNLDASERSLMKYETLGSLWSAIKPYVGQMTANEEKREERDKAYAEAEVIIDREDGFKVIVPKTEYAAKWFGKGTRWCTSADNNNMFHRYNEDAPLFIIFMPNGDKLQLWKNDTDIQFMDENDDNVDFEYIQDNWNQLKEVAKWIGDITYLSEEDITYELAMRYIKSYPMCLIEVPIDLVTKEMIIEVIKTDPALFKNIMDVANTTIFPYQKLLPIIDDEIEQLAVRLNPANYSHVREKNRELSLIYASHYGCNVNQIPGKFKKQDFFLEAVKKNGSLLKYIKEHNLTYDVCMDAVSNHGYMIEHIPEQFKTKKMCEVAISNNPFVITSIPEELRTPEMWEKAIALNGAIIQDIPYSLITQEMCNLASQQSSKFILDEIPTAMKTKDVITNIIKQGMRLDLLHQYEDCFTQEICNDLVNKLSYNYQYIPDKYKTVDLSIKACNTDPQLLENVPEAIRNEVTEAVKYNYFHKHDSVVEELKNILNHNPEYEPPVISM